MRGSVPNQRQSTISDGAVNSAGYPEAAADLAKTSECKRVQSVHRHACSQNISACWFRAEELYLSLVDGRHVRQRTTWFCNRITLNRRKKAEGRQPRATKFFEQTGGGAAYLLAVTAEKQAALAVSGADHLRARYSATTLWRCDITGRIPWAEYL
jgi:hypothetical protein